MMVKNGALAVFLTVLYVLHVADASLFYRKLVDESPKNDSSSTLVPPSPSPISAGNNLDSKAIVDDKSNDEESKKAAVPDNNSTKLDSNGSNTTNSSTPSPQNLTDNMKGSNNTDPATPPPQNLTDKQNGKNEEGLSKAPPQNKTDNGPSRTDSESQPAQHKMGSSNKDFETPPFNTKDDGINTKKNDDKLKPQSSNFENCSGMPNRCTDEETLVACIRTPHSGSKIHMVLIQNEGDHPLKVNVVVSTTEKSLELEIPKHQTERVNISLVGNKSNKLILNAGHGDCVLHINALVSQGNYFLRLPSYEKLVTPINGAYFLIFTVVVFGGTWACCKFSKRRRQEGVPYQELEMGLPDSFSANDLETAEGWDEGWDDDWNDDNAIKSPGGQHPRNISANGLSSRSPIRDGWENDWDD